MRIILFLVSLSFLTACADTSTIQPSDSAADIQISAETKQPNIVVILADDVALMDFGIYGGEAATPNIDALARRGMMFTNYHTSPMCAPSRAMLMTGLDSHRTGVPNLPIFLPASYKTKLGYEGILSADVITLAEHLKAQDYRTYVTGKWNLGHTQTSLPSKRGFDRSFILDASGADNYEQRHYLPGQGEPPWFKDGKPATLPDDFYSSRFLVDQMIEFMDEDKAANGSDAQAPFFAYISFQAIHIPVQVPRSFSEKYISTYDQGWQSIKERRFENAKKLGLVHDKAELGDMLPALRSWNALSPEQKDYAAKSMAVNAGMIEAMDFHIGRYVEYLKKTGEFENTIFVITSDNGPEASDPSLLPGMTQWLEETGYTMDYDTLGEEKSFTFIGPEFASAASGPSAFFKFYAGEGGLRVPLILSGPGVEQDMKSDAFSFVTDLTPTILDLVSTDTQAVNFDGRSLKPLTIGDANTVYSQEDAIGMEAAAQAALFRGDYKITRNNPPYGDGQWRLYNLKKDPGETQDLAKTQPQLFDSLMSDYVDYAKDVGVLEMPEGYNAIHEVLKQ